jgi:protein-L-isoaspartate(D-aspartate) O-methyltransferase
MVEEQIAGRGVRDKRVLETMRKVPRELFVPDAHSQGAFDDRPQPIGERQTISQPFMVGYMTELLALRGDERLLEIGTGSGYQTAILAELAREVITIERHESLSVRALELLDWLGYRNVRCVVGDGSIGWPAQAPYDAIIVTAGAPEIPQPLIDQLAAGGRLVAPIGPANEQILYRYNRLSGGQILRESHGRCAFVPLIGANGWPA